MQRFVKFTNAMFFSHFYICVLTWSSTLEIWMWKSAYMNWTRIKLWNWEFTYTLKLFNVVKKLTFTIAIKNTIKKILNNIEQDQIKQLVSSKRRPCKAVIWGLSCHLLLLLIFLLIITVFCSIPTYSARENLKFNKYDLNANKFMAHPLQLWEQCD